MNLIILSIPFLQLGINWWITISLMATMYLIIKVVKIRETHAPLMDSILLSTMAGMFVSITITSQSTNHDLIRIFREGLILLLLVQLTSGSVFISAYSLDKLPRSLLFTSSVELLFSTIQFIRLIGGSFFTLPRELYGGRGSTLPNYQDLIYSSIRPNGTFSEPSYLGLICVGLIICALTIESHGKMRLTLIIMNSLTILLSQSKLGYIGLVILLTIIIMKKTIVKKIKLVYLFFLLVILVLIFFLLNNSGAQVGLSFANRFRIPFSFVPPFILENPFGVPFHIRNSNLIEFDNRLMWGDILHNSFYNLIFSYGYIFLLILFLIYWPIRKDLILILFVTLAIIQNGSFLDFDKLVLTSIVCLLRLRKTQTRSNL